MDHGINSTVTYRSKKADCDATTSLCALKVRPSTLNVTSVCLPLWYRACRPLAGTKSLVMFSSILSKTWSDRMQLTMSMHAYVSIYSTRYPCRTCWSKVQLKTDQERDLGHSCSQRSIRYSDCRCSPSNPTYVNWLFSAFDVHSIDVYVMVLFKSRSSMSY